MEENEEELIRVKKRRRRYQVLMIVQFLILCLIVLINVKVIVPRLKTNEINREENQMNEVEIMAFNAKFSSYSGTQRGSQVNRLLDVIIKNNNKEKLKNETDRRIVSVSGEVTIDDNGNMLTESKVLTAGYYEVKTNTDEKGYINHFFIEKME